MALEKTDFATEYGVTLQRAYIKIDNIRIEEYEVIREYGSKSKNFTIMFLAEVYADKTARKDGKLPLDTKKINALFDINSDKNIYVQAYDYLKSLPKYTDAEDC